MATAAAGRRRAALADRPRHGRRRSEARDAAAARPGVGLVTGVEISALDVDGRDLHILGYGIERAARARRRARGFPRRPRAAGRTRMAEALRELGFELDDDVLAGRADAGQSIGRPHLAEAVVSHPANRARLRAEDACDPSAFLEAYLIEGRPAYRARESPTIPRGDRDDPPCGRRRRAGRTRSGTSPTPIRCGTRSTRFRAAGIDGVECFYVTHTREQTDALVDVLRDPRAAEHGLIRLPRARTPRVLALPRVQHLRSRARARTDRRLSCGRRPGPFRRRRCARRGAAPTLRLTRCSALSTVLQSHDSRRPTSS